MSKFGILTLMVAVAVFVGLNAPVFAADTCTTAAPAKAEKADKAGKAAAKPKTEVKCEVKGKLESKTITNKKGKEMKIFELTVSEAKDAEGKAMDALKGKKLHVAGKKGTKLTDYNGKDVTIAGTLINNKRLAVETIK